MAPVVLMFKLPVAVVAPKATAPAAFTVRLAPVRTSPPPKLFVAIARFVSKPVESIVVKPVMASLPVFVTAPAVDDTVNVPDKVLAPSTVALVLTKAAFDPVKLTAPVNDDDCVNVIAAAVAFNLV